MSRAASVVVFCMIGTIINAPLHYWILIASYFILCVHDNHFNN